MPKIVFWCPEAKAVGQTHAAIAVSTLMAMEEDYSNILLPGQWQSKKIGTAFEDYDLLNTKGVFNNSGIGLTALARLVTSNKITPEAIRNYSKPILKQRLDIMYGTNVNSREQFDLLISQFPSIVQKASEAYDIVWVDLPKTDQKEYIVETLKSADLVICAFNQEANLLQDYMPTLETNELLKDKKKIILMCDYEEKSRYNIPNIRRMFGIKEPIFAIPHNYIYTDACNMGNVVEGFFYKNIAADSNDYNGYFISETRKVVKKVLDLVRI
ncbi:MAG: hypothetical protein IKV94_04970 [Clostridia bacterium]|nr:hypothetical protein [Clostridia bacterium]